MLSEKETEKVDAAVEGIGVFVDTLLLISKTQDELSAQGRPAAQPEPMDTDEVGVIRPVSLRLLSACLGLAEAYLCCQSPGHLTDNVANCYMHPSQSCGL